MFQVFTGSFRALEKAFLSDFQARRKQDSLAHLLVLSPSGRLLTHLQSRLASAQAGYLNAHFLTFYAIAERLLSGSNYTEQVVTEPALHNEMIREILCGETPEPVDEAIRSALNARGKSIPRGLAGALAATMKDLRDSGMRADKALEAAREGFLGVEAPEAASTLALYARLVGQFEKHKLRSSADLLRRAAKEAPKHPWIQQQQAVFLYGFYDLTGVQLDFVLSLANHADARIYLPFENGNPAYAYAGKLLHDPAFLSKSRPVTVLGNDASRIASIELSSCSGARDEIWLAAKTILRLTDEGMPLHDIAVVARNLSAYTAPLREIFEAHELPFTSSRREPAGSHPLIKTIHTLLTFDARHPHVKTLQNDLEKSPYFNPPFPIAIAEDDVPRPWTVHRVWAKNLIGQSIRLPQDAGGEETALLKDGLAAIDDLRILDVLERPITRAHFLETLLEKLESLERPLSEKAHHGIQVLEVLQARGLSFQAVIVLGMNEKVFPRLIREDPFLSDAARSALAQATGFRLARKLDGYEEERFLFDLMRQAAGRQLFLTTQRSDEEGKALIPSVYLKDLERAVPGLTMERLPRAFPEKFDRLPPTSWTPKELSFLINRAHQDPKPAYAALGWDSAEFYRLLSIHHTLEAFAPGIGLHDGLLSNPSLVKSRLERPFSPSGLEDLAECPFQYYTRHILGIRVEEDLAPEGELTPRALGQLFHKTLELFYTACQQQGLPSDPETLSKRLAEALEGCFQTFGDNLSTVYPLALRSIKELIYKELSLFIGSELEELKQTGYKPRWFEQPLEGKLPIGDLTYHFYGKPDRLDTREELGITQVRVVDYKSGKPKPWTGRIETQIIQGKFLQLPIYLGLASQFAEKALGTKAMATEATLTPVRETDLEATEKTITHAFWESPSATLFIENIHELIKVLEKSSFYIRPSTGEWGYCARCDFALVCRKEHMPTRIRAERDPLRNRVIEKLSRIAPSKETGSPKPLKKGKSKNAA